MSAPRIRVTPQQRQGLHVPAAEEEGRGKRRIQAPNRLTYDALGKPDKSAVAGAALIVGDDEESDYEECAFAFFSPVEMPGEPATLKEALESSDAEEWKKAMESEVESIKENGTWELVEQRKYLEALAANFGQIESHVATPFPSGLNFVQGPKEDSVGEEERHRFHSLVGSLMYAAVNTRPDDAFATGQRARCGPKAWKILKDVHAPSSEAMVVVLERQLHAVKINEGDAVQGAFDQLRDLYVKLSAAGVDYPEKIKCYKALSLLPESWGPLVVNLNGMKDSWSLEWIRAQVLQEEFRRKELTAAAGEGGASAYGMKGLKGRGSKKGKAKEGSGGEQYSGGKRSNKRGKWPGQPSIEVSKGVHGAMGEGMGSEEGDGGAGGHGGMFYHVGEACSKDMVVSASKVALHRSSHWVIDTGAFMTMTNQEDLLDEVRPSKAATMHPHAPLLHISFDVEPKVEAHVTKGLALELVLNLQHHLLHKVRGGLESGLSGGAAPVAELAVLVGGSHFRHSRVVSGLSGGVLLLEVPVSLFLLVVPLVDAGGYGVGQQQQQCLLETLSPQQLREWAVRWGSPGGGGFRGTRTGGVEAPGGVEATSLGVCDSASAGAEPEEALHTFTLDSGTSRCFFRDSSTVTPLTAPVPVTLADPSGGRLGGKLMVICTDSRTGEHLAMFTRRSGSGLYILTTESALVAESEQIAVSVEVASSCSWRLFTHQTLLWHRRLGHPSLPRLRGIHSRLLVSALPRSLPPLLRSLAPPCLPCVKGQQRAAPHSSSFPLTTAPLQTPYMDVWGPARVSGQVGERYFLLVVDDYTRYTTVFLLLSKAEVWSILIRRIQTSRTLRWMGEVGDALPYRVWGALLLVRDPPAGKLSPCTLRCGPAHSDVSQVDPSPLVQPVEVSSNTSGPAEGGDLTPATTVTPRRSACLAVPPGFPPRPSSPPLQPVVVDFGAAGGGTTGGAGSGGAGFGGAGSGGAESPLGTGGTGGTGTCGPGTSRQEALLPERLREWAVQRGSPGGGACCLRAGGAGTAGAGGAGTAGAGGSATGGTGVASASGTGAPSRARTTRARGAGTPGAAGGTGGAAAVGGAAGSPGSRRQESLSPERLRKWAVRWGSPGGGAGCVGAAGSGGAGPGVACAGVPGTGGAGAAGGTRGAGAAGGTRGAGPGGACAGVPGVGRAGGTGTGGGADTGGNTGGTGVSGASRQESLSPLQLCEWAVRWGSPGGGAGGTGSEGAVDTGAGGSGDATTQPQPSALCHLLSLLPAAIEFPVFGTTPLLLFHRLTSLSHSYCLAPRCHLLLLTQSHDMTLRPSSIPQRVVLSSPRASSLPHVHSPESDLVYAASPSVTRLLAIVVADPSFETGAASALVAELVDFAGLCRIDYTASLVFYSFCPSSVGGELALSCDVLEDRHFELECLATAVPHLASTLLCPKRDPDALDIPTPRT
ncbi:unnamed protein product [Closterium sp. NIES-54]